MPFEMFKDAREETIKVLLAVLQHKIPGTKKDQYILIEKGEMQDKVQITQPLQKGKFCLKSYKEEYRIYIHIKWQN